MYGSPKTFRNLTGYFEFFGRRADLLANLGVELHCRVLWLEGPEEQPLPEVVERLLGRAHLR
ncbi:hypothetical protein [Amycolatopsis sp. NPDC057786]|uniref:hypothetical protein n=1 Tax=Amycolatopsis sp. NPDC057786 TaxID=3346250 RepID=UPI00366EF222